MGACGFPFAWVLDDALGILQAAVRFKAKDPAINAIYMELALLFAPHGAELSAIHLWSEINFLADAVSRLDEGVPLPSILAKVPRGYPRRDGFRIIGQSDMAH